jgi:hypothetical protein
MRRTSEQKRRLNRRQAARIHAQVASDAPVRNWTFVDVDGTLTKPVVEWCRRAKLGGGMRLVLWSARGQHYAIEAAKRMECEDLFEAIISKPGIIIDDQRWGWIKYTRAMHPTGCER